jgi:hypothetical protein
MCSILNKLKKRNYFEQNGTIPTTICKLSSQLDNVDYCFQFQNNQQANDPVEINDSESILSQIKMSRHKAIAEQLSSGLTEEQLQQEKE